MKHRGNRVYLQSNWIKNLVRKYDEKENIEHYQKVLYLYLLPVLNPKSYDGDQEVIGSIFSILESHC